MINVSFSRFCSFLYSSHIFAFYFLSFLVVTKNFMCPFSPIGAIIVWKWVKIVSLVRHILICSQNLGTEMNILCESLVPRKLNSFPGYQTPTLAIYLGLVCQESIPKIECVIAILVSASKISFHIPAKKVWSIIPNLK